MPDRQNGAVVDSSQSAALRSLPSVDQLLQTAQAAEFIAANGRPLVTEALRTALGEIREKLREGKASPSAPDNVLSAAADLLNQWTKPSLVPVINATGVILHTNLGRAPLSKAAVAAMTTAAQGYTNLEFDLERGVRGSRLVHAEALLKRLTGAEAALVVNNNASALLLALTALAKRRRVVISRTQLVEIGGGFRIPDVLRQSGAALVEIGATNRVHLRDYEEALEESSVRGAPAGLVLRAHHSNFRIIGFTEEPELSEIVRISHAHNIPALDDLGSGVLLDTARFGLAHEPTVQESLAAGADLVTISGDKLLGGPQAGIILGRADLIAKLKKHPLARAVRADKLCLAALSATLLHYFKDEAEREIPIWRMIAMTPEQAGERARQWAKQLGVGEVIAGQSTVGGGSLPEEVLPTMLLALDVKQPNRFLAKLRSAEIPVIARIEGDRVVFDPRTVLEEEEGKMVEMIRLSMHPSGGS